MTVLCSSRYITYWGMFRWRIFYGCFKPSIRIIKPVEDRTAICDVFPDQGAIMGYVPAEGFTAMVEAVKEIRRLEIAAGT